MTRPRASRRGRCSVDESVEPVMRRSARWPLENDLHQRGLDPACAQVSPHRGRGTTAAAADVGAGGPGRRGASRGRDSAEDCVEPSRGSAAVERADVAGRRPVSPIEPSHRLALRPHVRVRATSHTTTARVRRARTKARIASRSRPTSTTRPALRRAPSTPATAATAKCGVDTRPRNGKGDAARARTASLAACVRGRCQTRSARSRDLRLDRRHSR